jgi:uncharacterized protein YlxP (DUF503 family)
MVKQAAVPGIDEHAGWSRYQIGVAIVSSRRAPDKAINVIGNFHVTSPQSIITPKKVIDLSPRWNNNQP